jgi:hypothetical protein
MYYEFFIENGKVGWWLSKQSNFNMKFYSKRGWCLLSFYDPDCETVTSCMVYMINILCSMIFVRDCLGGPKMLDDALM